MRDFVEHSESDAMLSLTIKQPMADGKCLVFYAIKGRFHSYVTGRKTIRVESADHFLQAIASIIAALNTPS